MGAISTVTTGSRQSSPTPDLPVTLARHRSQDCYFDIKLTQLVSTTFHNKPAHQLHFKIDLARPFEVAKRIRSATVAITIHRSRRSHRSPRIVGIDPEASLVKIADHEVISGQTLGLAAGTAPVAPGALTATANMMWGDKTSYAGNRLIHGFMPTDTEAQWKMYEEPKSKSGLPPSLELLMIVRSDEEFWVSAEVCVSRWSGWGGVGMVQNIRAPMLDQEPRMFRVPSLSSGGLRAGWHKISDDIDVCLRESEQKLESLEVVIDRKFPQLQREKIYSGCGAVLALESRGKSSGLFDDKQINVPFYPNVRWIGRAASANGTKSRVTNGFFDSAVVSQRHAQIWANKDGTLWIRDINSAYGTFINGERLLHGESYRIRREDELRFGKDIYVKGKNGKTTLSQHAVEVIAGFVGLPGMSPEANLRLVLITPQTRADPDNTPVAKAKAAVKEVETKFKKWREMATGEEQLQQLTILEKLTRERMTVLGISEISSEPSRLSQPHESMGYSARRRSRRRTTDNYASFGPSGAQDYGRYDSEDSGDDDEIRIVRDRRASRSSKTGGQLFGGRAVTGEQALRNHRTVGGGWNETKL